MPPMVPAQRSGPITRAVFVASLVALVLVASALPTVAATGPYMVRDIKAGTGSSSPADLVDLGGIVLFTAGDGVRGRELWKSDGTATGTKRVKDIRPGGGGSNPRYLTRSGDVVFFSADDGNKGQELWKTDGTAAGTVLVKNIRPGGRSAFPQASVEPVFVDVGGVVYFAARDGVHGPELWRSDGTAAGTFLVADINPGSQGSEPDLLTSFNGRVYFRANNQLWRSNGTPAGTTRVRNRNGAFVKAPTEMTVSGSTLFMTINGALWRSNGTDAGTWKIGVAASSLTDVEGVVYFTNEGNQLARSDGTNNGTFLVRDLDQGLYDLTNVAGTLYFTVEGRLWKSDGTELGTRLVDPAGPMIWGQLTDVNGTLYFAANHDEGGETCCSPSQLWRTDGTAEGTEELAPSPDFPVWLTVSGDTLFFRATDANGRELWAYVP